jgi:hypothetical protein
MNQRDPAPIKNGRQSFAGRAELDPHAGSAGQHLPDLLNIAVLVDAKLLNRRLLIRPEAVADLHREPVEGDPTVGVRMPHADFAPAEFLQRIVHTLAVALEQVRQLHRLPYHPCTVPVHVQTQEYI